MRKSNQSVERIDVQSKRVLLTSTLPNGLKAENIQFMGKEELLRLQQHFDLGDTWGTIKVAAEWIRPSEAPSSGTYNLLNTMREYAHTEDDAELAYATLMRMVLLCFCTPAKLGNKQAATLDINSIRSKLASYWIPLAKSALEKPLREDGALLARIEKADLRQLTDAQNGRMSSELKRFKNYARRGFWWDVVQEAPKTKTETTNKKPKREPNKESVADPYKPLPDEFVLQTGKRATWLIQQVMPQALRAYDHILRLSEGVHPDTAGKRAQRYLRTLEWNLGDHGPLAADPYHLNLTQSENHSVEWPPQNREQLILLLKLCQTAAYFIVGLSAGTRGSEILSLQLDCLSESRDGILLANGRTYKLSPLFNGERRDWPIPGVALQAVEYQIELTRLINTSIKAEITSLWRIVASSRGFGNTLGVQYNDYLRDFSERIGTSHLLDKQAFTNHRFRKTIARLVALALVNAPKILMDIFGHKALEMTMHYILADKRLRAEIEQIQKEILAMTVEKAIANVESNGGPAAKKIKAEVARIKHVRAKEDLGAEDIHEVVVRMTSVGRQWTIVAAGVVCTKMRDQVGPCALGRSTPNPSRCSSQCDHRLEEADNMGQVDGVLAYIVKNIQIAHAKNDFLAIDAYEGQILAHIRRFDALYEKWSTHPIVAPIIARSVAEVEDAA